MLNVRLVVTHCPNFHSKTLYWLRMKVISSTTTKYPNDTRSLHLLSKFRHIYFVYSILEKWTLSYKNVKCLNGLSTEI